MQWSKRKLRILIAVLTVVLLMLSGTAGVMAKYATQETIGGQLTISANIGQIGVWDIPVEYNAATGYTKSETGYEHISSMSYSVIPGLDIPKDTIVRVDKNLDNDVDSADEANVPVYVYLIIKKDFTPSDNGINYTLESCWKELDSLKYPGVYVYSDANGPIALSSSADIPILVNDYIYVSQYVSGTFELKFEATMRQIYGNKSAAEIYSSDGFE